MNIIKLFSVLFLCFFIISCIDCKDYVNDISNDNFNLVVEIPPSDYAD